MRYLWLSFVIKFSVRESYELSECSCGKTHRYISQYKDQKCDAIVGYKQGKLTIFGRDQITLVCGKNATHIFSTTSARIGTTITDRHYLCDEHFQKLAVEEWGMETV